MKTLAERVDEMLNGYDHYGYVDADWDLEKTMETVEKEPEVVASWFMNLLDGKEDVTDDIPKRIYEYIKANDIPSGDDEYFEFNEDYV